MFGEFLIAGYTLIALNISSIFPLLTLPEPKVLAKSALIVDIKSGKKLYEKNPNEILPVASLMKLLSSLVVLDSIPLEKEITLSQEVINTLGEAGDFQAGEKVEARHLLFSSLIQSSNDAMMGLVSDLGENNFSLLLKSKAFQLGLKKVRITDPIGLSVETTAIASEVAKIAKAAFGNDFIKKILSIPEYTFTSRSGILHRAVSTNSLIFDRRVIVAKTGFLESVGQNYAALVKPAGLERELLLILLGSPNRDKDTFTLLNWLDRAFIWE